MRSESILVDQVYRGRRPGIRWVVALIEPNPAVHRPASVEYRAFGTKMRQRVIPLASFAEWATECLGDRDRWETISFTADHRQILAWLNEQYEAVTPHAICKALQLQSTPRTRTALMDLEVMGRVRKVREAASNKGRRGARMSWWVAL